MKNRFHYLDLVCLSIIIALIAFNYWLFSLVFDRDYLRWYLVNGAQISWVVSLITLIWGDLNKNVMMISSRPMEYVAGNFALLAITFKAIVPPGRDQMADDGPITLYMWDMFIALLFLIIFGISLIAWLIIMVPVQYFVFLLSGAPSRLMLFSKEIPIASIDGKVRLNNLGKGMKVPENWMNISIKEKPVSITNGFTGMLLWMLGLFIDKIFPVAESLTVTSPVG